MLSDEQKKKIIQKLQEKSATNPCPRCNNKEFSVIDGYINQTLQDDIKNIKVGGTSIPSVVVACNRCGFLSQHALGALGIFP